MGIVCSIFLSIYRLFFCTIIGGLLNLSVNAVNAVILVLGQESADEAQYHDAGGETPSGFLEHVSSLANTHHLVGGCEIGSQTAALGVLNQYNKA